MNSREQSEVLKLPARNGIELIEEDVSADVLAEDGDADDFQLLYDPSVFQNATKAFGRGIDIADIAVVAHFAPTGNVSDAFE